jgi:hypothetical protein
MFRSVEAEIEGNFLFRRFKIGFLSILFDHFSPCIVNDVAEKNGTIRIIIIRVPVNIALLMGTRAFLLLTPRRSP